MAAPCAAILAGGRSRRMGRDKAALIVEGEPLLARTARIAAACGLPVLIVGRDPTQGPAIGPGTQFVCDAVPGIGPLGGLLGALRHAGTDVLALACDMPRLTPAALHWLIGTTAAGLLQHGLVSNRGGRLEPLFAIYTQSCVSLIESQVTAGDHALRSLIRAGRFSFAEVPEELSGCLHNLNTPDDLEGIAL